MKIGELIKKQRIKKGLTQKALANKLGYPIPQFISLVENGHAKLPLEIVPQLIDILGIPETVLVNKLTAEYKQVALRAIGK